MDTTSKKPTARKPAQPKRKENPSNMAQLEARYEELKKDTKTKYNGRVYMVAVPREVPQAGDTDTPIKFAVAYLRQPQRPELQRYLGIKSRGMIYDATEALMSDTWIEGDDDMLTNDDLFYGAHNAMTGMIEMRMGVLKKS